MSAGRLVGRVKPISPGTSMMLHGQRWKVGAVGITGGERYYWLFRDRGRTVAMLPAFVVEDTARAGLEGK